MFFKHSEFISFQHKLRSELCDFENKMSSGDYNLLISYITSMYFESSNCTKEFIGLYGEGKRELTEKICSLMNDKYFNARWYHKYNENKKNTGDIMYIYPEFINANLIIFRDDHVERFHDIKMCTSGDMKVMRDGNYYVLDKYVIVEFDKEVELDDTLKHRQIKIQLL